MSDVSSLGEQPVLFTCEGERLVGIVSGSHAQHPRVAVVIVVGGPQYRVGSHRQFTLLARRLACEGVPALRFDYRGMGDSEGGLRNFEQVRADIRCAVDTLAASLGDGVPIVLWGLCDAASAVLFYAPTDQRVKGLVLLNPWARTEAGAAKMLVRHYYLRRMFDKELWRKVFGGGLAWGESLRSLASQVSRALGTRDADRSTSCDGRNSAEPLPERLADSLRNFRGPILLILSGNDLTAQEFKAHVESNPRLAREARSGRVTWKELESANHTFSSRSWRGSVEDWTVTWLGSAPL